MAELVRRCQPWLGTFVEVTADLEEAIEAAFAAVERVHRLMSAHELKSDLSRINRFAHLRPVEVHDWTARVIELARSWSKRSEGAFDVVRAGKAALEQGLIPRHREQPQPEAPDWTCLDLQGGSARLSMPGSVDFGGIAKGFAVDRAIDALRAAGCERGLVNAGGDLRGFGPEPWTVGIVEPLTRRPVAEIEIHNEALATSAGLLDSGQLSFDHLGGVSRWTSVSVLARTASDADALTKILWATGGLPRGADATGLALTGKGKIELIREAAEVAA